MKRTMIAQARAGAGVLLQGFVEHIRNKRTMAFVVLRDRTGSMQVTIDKEARPDLAAMADALTVESAVSVWGAVAENAHVKLGGREMLPEGMRIESLAEPLPLMAGSGLDTRLDYRWLDLRSAKNQLIFDAQTLMAERFRAFLRAEGFVELHTPKLIGAASESGSDVFELTYFDRKAYLSQSPQFYKQMAMAAGMERIFEVGPVFRAEKSHTRRHSTEFTGFDVEMSWIASYRDVMALEAGMLADALGAVAARYGGAVEQLYGTKVVVPALPFPEIGLDALYGELERRYGYVVADEERGDLTTEAEQLCYRFSMEAFGHEFLFVTGYPAGRRAFYHMREAGVAQGYDLLWRGVEITTGAQREHRHARLAAQAREAGLGEDVKFYTEFFRYGCPPHGGFGLGLDRLTMLLFGISIKEAMFIFRGPERLEP